MAKSEKKTVAMFSLEMSREQLATRLLSSEAVSYTHLDVYKRQVIGDQGHFSEVAGAFVHTDGGFQEFLALFCMGLYDLAVPDDEMELVDDIAAVHQRSLRRSAR